MNIRKALAIERGILESDPEWATQKPVHPGTLMQCFVQGVMAADTWYPGYTLPPNFENVVNYVAFHINRKWKDVVMLSLLEFEDFLHDVCPENPFFVAWNVGSGSGFRVPFAKPTSRQYISLHEVYRGATVALRNDNRLNEAAILAFDAAFKAFTDPSAHD